MAVLHKQRPILSQSVVAWVTSFDFPARNIGIHTHSLEPATSAPSRKRRADSFFGIHFDARRKASPNRQNEKLAGPQECANLIVSPPPFRACSSVG